MRFFCTCIIIYNKIKRIVIKEVIHENVSALKNMSLLNERVYQLSSIMDGKSTPSRHTVMKCQGIRRKVSTASREKEKWFSMSALETNAFTFFRGNYDLLRILYINKILVQCISPRRHGSRRQREGTARTTAQEAREQPVPLKGVMLGTPIEMSVE